jgi:MOSC domain-containing protein YiiM
MARETRPTDISALGNRSPNLKIESDIYKNSSGEIKMTLDKKPPTLPTLGRRGRIHAVSVSDRKGVVKHNVDQARLLVDHGLAGDAHAEGGIRQVSLLARESIDKMVAAGAKVAPGDFAENLTVEGLEVMTLPVGTRLKVGGEVELEVTQIGKTCHKGCAIRELVGDCVMPKEGIFARVLKAGLVKPGDTIEVVYVPGGHSDGK